MMFKSVLIKQITELTNVDVTYLLDDNPPQGDFALPCFKFAKEFGCNPKEAADKLVELLDVPAFISKIETAGPYVNFYVNTQAMVQEVHGITETFGSSDLGKGTTVVMDYCAVNVGKPFGVGHLRSTVIGGCLDKVYDKLGYTVVAENYLGDWGTQYGKLLVAYDMYGDPDKLTQDPIRHLYDIYTKFHQEETPEMLEKARATFKQLEDGNKELLARMEEFRQFSMTEAIRICEALNADFDTHNGEAFYQPFAKDAVEFVQSKTHTEVSDGALIVPMEPAPLMLLKSNGATTYHSRDLATARYRIKEYKADKILYVVGSPQSLHFEQLFETLKRCGYPDMFEHVKFGLLTLPEGKISTRKGNLIFLDDVFKRATEKILEIINEKNPQLPNKEDTAFKIAVGAIIFADLKTDRVKNVVFDWDTVLNFDGETGPYLMYTHARACSILRSVEKMPATFEHASIVEHDLSKHLLTFPDMLVQTHTHNKPHILAQYTIKLAQLFNEYYVNAKVDGVEEQGVRYMMVEKSQAVLKQCLTLLGMHAPNEM